MSEGGRKRRRKHGNRTLAFVLPSVEKIRQWSVRDQVMIWRRMKDYQTIEGRRRWNAINGSHRKLPAIADLAALSGAIERRWAELHHELKSSDDFFEWPSTIAWIGDGAFLATDDFGEPVLSTFGYTVSQEDGLSAKQRHERLGDIFHLTLPPAFDLPTLRQWGDGASPLRLQKMAKCLATFTRNAKRRRADDRRLAISKWEADLQHLYCRYYANHFLFAWPSTEIFSD